LARGQPGGEVLAFLDQAHALAATAGGRLDQDRIADGVGLPLQERRLLIVPMVTRCQRDTGSGHQRLGRGFRTHGADRCGRRTDEYDSGGRAGVGKTVVFGEKAVAGMDGLRAGPAGGIEKPVSDQVGLAGGSRTDTHGFVGEAHVARVGIGLGVDGNGADAHTACRPDHATGDLAAVGNQNLGKHRAPFHASQRQFTVQEASPV
jgi:hypothetical protein